MTYYLIGLTVEHVEGRVGFRTRHIRARRKALQPKALGAASPLIFLVFYMVLLFPRLEMPCLCDSGVIRVRLADLNGPKWTSLDQNGPK